MQLLKKIITNGLMVLSLSFSTMISAMAIGSETTRALAEQGDAEAQHQLGWDYIWAFGGTPDSNKSFEWHLKAANQGLAKAQFSVGDRYYFGPSTEEGPTKGQGVAQNYYTAFKWYEKAANQGHSESQLRLGLMYEKGYGVRQDHTKAIQWYKKSANQGYARSLFRLGLIYRDGQIVKQDKAIAKEWFGKACDKGFQSSCDAYRELNEQGY